MVERLGEVVGCARVEVVAGLIEQERQGRAKIITSDLRPVPVVRQRPLEGRPMHELIPRIGRVEHRHGGPGPQRRATRLRLPRG